MYQPQVLILFAQRPDDASHLLRALDTHPDIACVSEAFDLARKDAPDPAVRNTNYFHFLCRYSAGNLERVFPDRQEEVFLDYLEYLRCFSQKRWLLLHVATDTIHLFTQPRLPSVTSPFLLDLIVTHELRVLHLRRRNLLPSVLREYLALNPPETGRPSRWPAPINEPPVLEVPALLKALTQRQQQDRLIARHFASYKYHLACYFEALFSRRAPAALPEFLGKLAASMDLPNSFSAPAEAPGEAEADVAAGLANWPALAEALRGTRFERCLTQAA